MNDGSVTRHAPSPAALRFGLPSKGRLQSLTADFLGAAGMTLVKSAVDREYAGELRGVDGVELVFLQAGEMPAKLQRGDIHLGVTGVDLIRERTPHWRESISLLQPLGFGHARLVAAVPKCWLDVSTTEDLDDVAAEFRERHGHPLRVATKFSRLSREYFREKGVVNYRLVDSQGATEGLVAAGAAEAIVDLTSSGETLRANHLKILEDGLVLESEAHLCASLTAPWGDEARATLGRVLDRIAGAAAKSGRIRIEAEIETVDLERAEGALAKLGVSMDAPRPEDGGLVHLLAPAAKLGLAVDVLTAAGAASVRAAAADTTDGHGPGRSMFDMFEEALRARPR